MMSSLGFATKAALTCLALTACGSTSTTPIAALSPMPSSTSPTTIVKSDCPNDPRSHVYSPDRLQLIAACVTVTGTIESEQGEPDGDFHVRCDSILGRLVLAFPVSTQRT